MGGKAMKLYGIETRRYETNEYLKLWEELKPRIEKLFPTELHLVQCYHSKPDHGDMDILVLNDGTLGNIREKLIEEFNLETIHSGGGSVYSFEYKDFQIDIIPQPTRNWETAICFFDYDPTGNLMGKLAHKFGLKYGFEGLIYPFRNCDGRQSADFIISKDLPKIFKFLGLSYETYIKGFENTEEIFEYIIGSDYFNSESFQFEVLVAKDRKRNRKRKTFNEFLEYIKDKNIDKQFEWKKDKKAYIEMINDCFPESKIKEKIEEAERIDAENQEIKKKFNGKLVMEWTGLEGKQLGDVLGKFKAVFITDEIYRKALLDHTPEEIKERFMNWFKYYE